MRKNRLIQLFLMGSVLITAQAYALSGHQNYDLYESFKKKSPTVLFVHGGAWISGSKDQYKDIGQAFQKQNTCVAILEYSLAPQAQHPKPVRELHDLVKTLIRKKSKNCDFKNIFMMGHSAGAHMIAYWGAKHRTKNIRGFIGLEGIYDLPGLAAKWPEYQDRFLKKAFGDSKNWLKASPAKLIMKNKSPWLIIHSDKDELVDLRQSTHFANELKLQVIKTEFLHLENEKHFDVVDQLKDPNHPLLKNILKFIEINKGH